MKQMKNLNYPEAPGWKTEQPETSRQAATQIKGRANILRARCLELLNEPLTADEVAAKLGESVLSIRPRVTELNKQGKIEDTGHRRRNALGSSAAVWCTKRELKQGEML